MPAILRTSSYTLVASRYPHPESINDSPVLRQQWLELDGITQGGGKRAAERGPGKILFRA
ncbi:hypothetical protein ITP53_14970 [Nonomuraea sp. K274]|uniref:Uncharacterized protein n=1 Tax=Nonomuraea cypriaca TaxID=1187855 RepID=A0A931ABM7_9ACTN|nr:hypothetical protein [Nonomuraea cypriaca]MBF8187015.1 hypothetical protein [Nonomuraea cypriaca]